ncbi:MAG: GIY-YIG nuclease family protein [Alphaproteobacteria bacterium]|nr:GIY-YIG nuclease family protein [Alphaproteobacteria bacterium]
MTKEFTTQDDELLAELGVDVEAKKTTDRTPREERIIAGFEDIQRFVEEHERPPRHGEDRDIFERLYAVRLDRLREQEDCRALLAEFDHQELLAGAVSSDGDLADNLDDDALLAKLGVEANAPNIAELRHVRSSSEKRAAEEIANRDQCEDFEQFKPLFEKAKRELETEVRTAKVIRKDAGFLKTDIKQGQFFILGGQTLYVADVGEQIKAPNGEMDARLRVIYSNGTESNLLLRSLTRAIYKDETSRAITEPNLGPLFGEDVDEDDQTTGTIYVLRSKSDHPTISENRDVIHKIGVTGGDVKIRISNAKTDPTYLFADVDVVQTYTLANINRSRLENLLHRVFSPARLQIDIPDRFGRSVKPKEWFLVPLHVIDEAVKRIKDRSITDYTYDPSSAQLKKTSDK